MNKGLFIVIEGIDGSGKTTQIELLKQALASQGLALEAISFPRYEDNVYGKLVRRYLDGEFGSINEVNPYLMALSFAGDRALAKFQIEQWLRDGKVVLVNRYVSSSKAHLGANLAEEKRAEFIDWLDELEYQNNGIPKENLTILLSVDPKIGQQNTVNQDIHEKNIKHLEEANKIYLELAKKDSSWYVIDCMQADGMRSREDIHQEIMHILQNKLDE